MATTRRLIHFSNNREPKEGDKIIYIGGSWDLMHNGHIERLKRAKEMGDFVYAGVWSDEIVSYYKGNNFPLMSLHERVLMVLSCKYVDDVVIGAPYEITKDFLKSLNIHKVANCVQTNMEVQEDKNDIDPYRIPKEMGIYEEFDTELKLSVDEIA